MLEAFSAYIKNIAVFTLFAAFAELLMPENNFKKYLHFVLGLLLLTAVLKPMFSLLGTDFEGKTIQKTLSVWCRNGCQLLNCTVIKIIYQAVTGITAFLGLYAVYCLLHSFKYLLQEIRLKLFAGT